MEFDGIEIEDVRLHRQKLAEAFDRWQPQLDQWEKFEDDYSRVHDRLRTITDKTSHDVMVPFGKVAFMPGKLIHTNELVVLLGDNWFAERSAKQTLDIINRRMECMCLVCEQRLQKHEIYDHIQLFTSMESAFTTVDVAEKKAEVQRQLDDLMTRSHLSSEFTGDFGVDDTGNPIMEIVERPNDTVSEASLAASDTNRHRRRIAHVPSSVTAQHTQNTVAMETNDEKLGSDIAQGQRPLSELHDVYVPEQEQSLTTAEMWTELEQLELEERQEVYVDNEALLLKPTETISSVPTKKVSFSPNLEIEHVLPQSTPAQRPMPVSIETRERHWQERSAQAATGVGPPVPFTGGVMERTDNEQTIATNVDSQVEPQSAARVSRFKAARGGQR